MRHDRIAVLATALTVMAGAAGAQNNTCTLGGTVVGGGGPVAGAEVSLPKFELKATTDSLGRFLLTSVACGRSELQIRKIGFTVSRDSVLVAPDQPSRTYTMVAVAQLDTMKTTADEIYYQSPRLQDFEARRKRNVGGYFIGEAQLRKLEGLSTESILRGRFPGLQFASYRGVTAAKTSRAASINGLLLMNPTDARSPKGCWVVVYLDGLLIFDGVPKQGSLPPDIAQFMGAGLSGIEYYSGAGAIPLQFKTGYTSCGTLLLWTRGR